MYKRMLCIIKLNNLNLYKYTYNIFRVKVHDHGEHTGYTYQTQQGMKYTKCVSRMVEKQRQSKPHSYVVLLTPLEPSACQLLWPLSCLCSVITTRNHMQVPVYNSHHWDQP